MREKQLDDIYNIPIYKNYFFIDLIEKKQLEVIYYVVVEALQLLFPNETNKKGVQRRVFRRHSFRFAQSLGETLAANFFRFALRNWGRRNGFRRRLCFGFANLFCWRYAGRSLGWLGLRGKLPRA